MTKRDDSWPRSAVLVDANALRFLELEEQELFRWLAGYVGTALMNDGVAASDVRVILQEVFTEYRRESSDAIADPHAFLLRRVQTRVQDRRRMRGVSPAAPAAPEPWLLDKIRTQDTLASLAPEARRAMEILFYEGGTFETVAAEQELSVEYVKRLVAKVLREIAAAPGTPKNPWER